MAALPDLRPIDATLSVTRAAHVLGVHPNTVRAWSDQGRLRYFRINSRGDRRYRAADLRRFLAHAEHATQVSPHAAAPPHHPRIGPGRRAGRGALATSRPIRPGPGRALPASAGLQAAAVHWLAALSALASLGAPPDRFLDD